ncbi:MAG: hypothetical protein QHH07_06575 [Sedimentisphaerales bacterium]|nr:hypothetical protein [Sedimentisphaerales bacterium]
MVDGSKALVTVDGNYKLTAVFEQVLYDFTLDANPGWTTGGQWEFGRPLGQGGQQYGNPDPSRGHTGQNVFGVNLSGDYALTVGGPYCLTAGPFDLSTAKGTRLHFFRWLNADEPAYVRCAVEVSIDGARTVWVPILEHVDRNPITDNSWVQQDLDLSLADGQPNVYVRWLYQIKPNAYPYSGWNIDGIQLIGGLGCR